MATTAPTSAPTGAPSTRDLLTTADRRRRLTDRGMTVVVSLAFALALVPLLSLAWTVVSNGAETQATLLVNLSR